jgi:hypothetical protein
MDEIEIPQKHFKYTGAAKTYNNTMNENQKLFAPCLRCSQYLFFPT